MVNYTTIIFILVFILFFIIIIYIIFKNNKKTNNNNVLIKPIVLGYIIPKTIEYFTLDEENTFAFPDANCISFWLKLLSKKQTNILFSNNIVDTDSINNDDECKNQSNSVNFTISLINNKLQFSYNICKNKYIVETNEIIEYNKLSHIFIYFTDENIILYKDGVINQTLNIDSINLGDLMIANKKFMIGNDYINNEGYKLIGRIYNFNFYNYEIIDKNISLIYNNEKDEINNTDTNFGLIVPKTTNSYTIPETIEDFTLDRNNTIIYPNANCISFWLKLLSEKQTNILFSNYMVGCDGNNLANKNKFIIEIYENRLRFYYCMCDDRIHFDLYSEILDLYKRLTHLFIYLKDENIVIYKNGKFFQILGITDVKLKLNTLMLVDKNFIIGNDHRNKDLLKLIGRIYRFSFYNYISSQEEYVKKIYNNEVIKITKEDKDYELIEPIKLTDIEIPVLLNNFMYDQNNTFAFPEANCISFWIQLLTYKEKNIIFSNFNSGTGDKFSIETVNNKLQFLYKIRNEVANIDLTNEITNPATITHIFLYFNGNIITIYKDGELFQTIKLSFKTFSIYNLMLIKEKFMIGNDYKKNIEHTLIGRIFNFNFYNHEIVAKNVLLIYNNEVKSVE